LQGNHLPDNDVSDNLVDPNAPAETLRDGEQIVGLFLLHFEGHLDARGDLRRLTALLFWRLGQSDDRD
jgi:hypothetical protein